MLFENSKQVKLSEVELDSVSTNELKVIFVPQKDYEEERRIFNENYPDGDSEFNMFYEILFTVYVTYEGQPGVLVFTYNTDSCTAEPESDNADSDNVTTAFMKLMNECREIDLFEHDIYDQETLEEEGIPTTPFFLLMWLAAALVTDNLGPRDVFNMGMTHYKGVVCPYCHCNPNWFNFQIKLHINISYDLLDVVKDWLKSPAHFTIFKKFHKVAKQLGITTAMVEEAAE